MMQDNIFSEQKEMEALQDVQMTARHFLMQDIKVDFSMVIVISTI